MTWQLHPGWRNQTAENSYPFSDAASLQSVDRRYILPRALFLDAALYPLGGQARQFLSKITSTATDVTFTVSDQVQELATGRYVHGSGAATVTLEDSFGRPAGILVLAPSLVGLISGWTDVRFDVDGAELCASAVIPVRDDGVRALQVADEILTGEVWIVAGKGVLWTLDSGYPRLDIVGDPYYKRRKCQAAGQPFTEVPCFQTLNSLRPGPGGNVAILSGTEVFDNALRVEVKDGQLHFFLAGGRDDHG